MATNGITPAGAGKTRGKRTQHRGSRDHPRRCGENHAALYGCEVAAGSPPQVRGKLLLQKPQADNRRITPAGAGKTLLRSCVIVGVEDHPRRCGENNAWCKRIYGCTGSPPQVRGKLCGRLHIGCIRGITPAGAGKTSSQFAPQGRTQGSPPQVRGKPDHALDALRYAGITPAGAGKTAAQYRSVVVAGDHPRRCGENKYILPNSC